MWVSAADAVLPVFSVKTIITLFFFFIYRVIVLIVILVTQKKV